MGEGQSGKFQTFTGNSNLKASSKERNLRLTIMGKSFTVNVDSKTQIERVQLWGHTNIGRPYELNK